MSKKPKSPQPVASTTDAMDSAFAPSPAAGCPVKPNPATDWRIPGSWSDAQVGHTIRDLTSKSYVLALWVCDGELWVRPIDPNKSTLVAQA